MAVVVDPHWIGVLSLALLGTIALLPDAALAQGAIRVGGARRNAAGGVTAGSAAAVRTPYGGAARAGGVVTDGQGNVAAGSAAGFRTPYAAGARAGYTTRTADGTVQHKGGAAVSGARGTATTTGGFTKTATGEVTGARNTTIQSRSGGSYQGNTTYNKGSGFTHSGTCYNAAGQVVPCRK